MEDSGFAMGYAMGQDSGGSRNSGMFGNGDGWLWIIVIFALLFGWNRGGDQGGSSGGSSGGGDSMAAFIPYLAGSFSSGGGAATQGALTREQACIDNNFNNLDRTVESIASAVNQGFTTLDTRVCQQSYETAGLINGLGMNMMQGFNAANVVALQNANAAATQLADCCCQTQRAIDGVNFNNERNTCALQNTIQTGFRDSIEATQAGTRAILDYLCQEKIADLQSENQALRLSASQERQNAYLINQLRPTAVPAYLTCSPYASAYGLYGLSGFGGYGNGGCCGCNG